MKKNSSKPASKVNLLHLLQELSFQKPDLPEQHRNTSRLHQFISNTDNAELKKFLTNNQGDLHNMDEKLLELLPVIFQMADTLPLQKTIVKNPYLLYPQHQTTELVKDLTTYLLSLDMHWEEKAQFKKHIDQLLSQREGLTLKIMNGKNKDLKSFIAKNLPLWLTLSDAKKEIIQQSFNYPKLKSKIIDNPKFWGTLDDKIAASLVQLHFDQKQPDNVLSDTFVDRITNNESAIAKLDTESLQDLQRMYDRYYDNKTLISFVESNLPDIATTPHKDKLYHYWNTLLRPVPSPTLEKFLQDRITELPKLNTQKLLTLNSVLLEEKLHPNLNGLYRLMNKDTSGKIFNKAFKISQELAPDKRKVNKFLFIINKDLQRLPIDEIGEALKNNNPKYLEFLDKNFKQFVDLPPKKRAYIAKVFNDDSERARKITNIALNPRYAKTMVDQIALTNVNTISDLSDSFIERTLEKMHFSPERIARVLQPNTLENQRSVLDAQQVDQNDDSTEATATDITLDDDLDLMDAPDHLSYDDTGLYDFLASPEEFEQAVQDYKAHHGIPSAAAEESIASSEHPSVGFDDLDYNSDELSEELHEVIENMDRLDKEVLEANDALQNVKAKYPTPAKTTKPAKRFPFFNKKQNTETSKEKSKASKYSAFKITQAKKTDSKPKTAASSSTKKTNAKKANPLSKIKKKMKF